MVGADVAALMQSEGCGHDGAGRDRAHRVSWAKLLARVFLYDVTLCPSCAGRMKVIAALTEAAAIHAFLNAVGLPSRAPPIACGARGRRDRAWPATATGTSPHRIEMM